MTSALIIWKALMCVTGSESPVVVVLSGSMEPGFKRVKIEIILTMALPFFFFTMRYANSEMNLI